MGCEEVEGDGRMQHMKCLVLSLSLSLLVLTIFHLQLRTEVSQLKAIQVTPEYKRISLYFLILKTRIHQ